MKARKLRLLRCRHGISYAELGKACGLSAQRMSEIELSSRNLEPATEEKIRKGLWEVVARRSDHLDQLRVDILNHETSLFEFVEVDHYEL